MEPIITGKASALKIICCCISKIMPLNIYIRASNRRWEKLFNPVKYCEVNQKCVVALVQKDDYKSPRVQNPNCYVIDELIVLAADLCEFILSLSHNQGSATENTDPKILR